MAVLESSRVKSLFLLVDIVSAVYLEASCHWCLCDYY